MIDDSQRKLIFSTGRWIFPTARIENDDGHLTVCFSDKKYSPPVIYTLPEYQGDEKSGYSELSTQESLELAEYQLKLWGKYYHQKKKDLDLENAVYKVPETTGG